MNPFGLTIPIVPGELPLGGIVAARVLDQYIDAAAVISRNRSRAAAVLLAARQRRAHMRRQAEQCIEAAHEEAARLAAEASRRAHDETCDAVVRWLVQEQDIEQAVAAQLESRCKAWVAETLRALLAPMDPTEMLVGHLAPQMRRAMAHGAVTIRVCPSELDAVQARLPAEAGVALIADPALAVGQAWLDSPYVQLRLDLARHIEHTIDLIAGQARGTGADLLEAAEIPGDGQR